MSENLTGNEANDDDLRIALASIERKITSDPEAAKAEFQALTDRLNQNAEGPRSPLQESIEERLVAIQQRLFGKSEPTLDGTGE